ncbi:hypothetical protein HYH03_003469 [Edaphochlamys debaryana]|uniref:Myb-like domain-containing protein n=1 Tax=Edaphochlamys debaryana TaxID=47281 RepID=A0A836C4G2_9CHLO|nr:hypothetical protein HYH03_003469 [Edaphochlamys debaryana]|eukprot:KAG2498729.1 hypothetical protein HYH03_003469 [Edaphochlamys debaryana]
MSSRLAARSGRPPPLATNPNWSKHWRSAELVQLVQLHAEHGNSWATLGKLLKRDRHGVKSIFASAARGKSSVADRSNWGRCLLRAYARILKTTDHRAAALDAAYAEARQVQGGVAPRAEAVPVAATEGAMEEARAEETEAEAEAKEDEDEDEEDVQRVEGMDSVEGRGRGHGGGAAASRRTRPLPPTSPPQQLLLPLPLALPLPLPMPPQEAFQARGPSASAGSPPAGPRAAVAAASSASSSPLRPAPWPSTPAAAPAGSPRLSSGLSLSAGLSPGGASWLPVPSIRQAAWSPLSCASPIPSATGPWGPSPGWTQIHPANNLPRQPMVQQGPAPPHAAYPQLWGWACTQTQPSPWGPQPGCWDPQPGCWDPQPGSWAPPRDHYGPASSAASLPTSLPMWQGPGPGVSGPSQALPPRCSFGEVQGHRESGCGSGNWGACTSFSCNWEQGRARHEDEDQSWGRQGQVTQAYASAAAEDESIRLEVEAFLHGEGAMSWPSATAATPLGGSGQEMHMDCPLRVDPPMQWAA